mmetsp:Transcript_52926/g.146659  ORF Transcript_52926/g.146659 Transcript_52926/m.146659 type:complete len:392 (+) Transcript_52926:505-1680(+)
MPAAFATARRSCSTTRTYSANACATKERSACVAAFAPLRTRGGSSWCHTSLRLTSGTPRRTSSRTTSRRSGVRLVGRTTGRPACTRTPTGIGGGCRPSATPRGPARTGHAAPLPGHWRWLTATVAPEEWPARWPTAARSSSITRASTRPTLAVKSNARGAPSAPSTTGRATRAAAARWMRRCSHHCESETSCRTPRSCWRCCNPRASSHRSTMPWRTPRARAAPVALPAAVRHPRAAAVAEPAQGAGGRRSQRARGRRWLLSLPGRTLGHLHGRGQQRRTPGASRHAASQAWHSCRSLGLGHTCRRPPVPAAAAGGTRRSRSTLSRTTASGCLMQILMGKPSTTPTMAAESLWTVGELPPMTASGPWSGTWQPCPCCRRRQRPCHPLKAGG